MGTKFLGTLPLTYLTWPDHSNPALSLSAPKLHMVQARGTTRGDIFAKSWLWVIASQWPG
jgi:hypothetical protein